MKTQGWTSGGDVPEPPAAPQLENLRGPRLGLASSRLKSELSARAGREVCAIVRYLRKPIK